MRISDWSSDVCSSDLHERARRRQPFPYHLVARRRPDGEGKQRRDRRLRMDGRRSRPHRAPAGALEGVTMQLYLDCDGVLADFDRGATALLGMPPRAYEQRHGIAAFWRELARHPDFYGTLPLMPDAKELFAAVRHLISSE